MAAIIIPNGTTFGGMTNQMVSRIVSLNSTLLRLQEAIATASAGFEGTPGTQFEAASGGMMPMPQNNFGIAPDPDNPGKQGTDYAYAVGRLNESWAAFWTVAEPFVAQLDNGTPGF